jgi:hypothetical protein
VQNARQDLPNTATIAALTRKNLPQLEKANGAEKFLRAARKPHFPVFF